MENACSNGEQYDGESCIIIKSRSSTGVRIRPGTATPDKHWAYLICDKYSEWHQHIYPVYPDNGDSIELHIRKKFSELNPEGFEWVMQFVEENDNLCEYDPEICLHCVGHPRCVSRR